MSTFEDACKAFTIAAIVLTPARRLAEEYVDYERDCLELQLLIGSSLSTEQFRAIVTEVATQSTHPNHSVPKHLQALYLNRLMLKNMFRHQVSERDACEAIANHPVDCAELCMSKFMMLLKSR